MSSNGIDVKLLEQSVFAVADGYCSINLTKNYIPGVMYQVVDGKLYDLNVQIGLPQDAPFTETVEEWAKTVPEEERNAFLEALDRDRLLACFEKGERLLCFGYWTRTATYEKMYAEDHLAMFEDPETGDVLAVNYVIDRAKQIRLSEENDKYQQQIISFRNVHAALKSGAWNLLYNLDGNLNQVNWSDTLRDMLGYQSQDDFPNTFEAWSDKLYPEDKEYTLHEYELVLEDLTGRKTFDVEYRLLSKNGEYHWFHAVGNLSRREDRTPQSFDGVFVNIDDEHSKDIALQNALREAQENRDELLLEHEIISSVSRLYFSMYRIDLKNDFYEEISSDQSVHRLTGHEGRAQRKMYELCDSIVAKEDQDAVRHFFNLSTVPLRLENSDTVEIEYRAADGNWHQARFIEKKRDEKGTVTHILYVTRIVSEEKKKELDKQRLEVAYQVAESANEAKTTFLLNMSHDIRTPMNAIIGYSQLMRKSLDDLHLDDSNLIHYQEMIEESGDILLSIINNVLDMAKIESGKMELDENYDKVGSIVGKICQVYQEEADKKDIALIFNEKVSNHHILCDATKIEEVFTNLISNAIKYTQKGGRIVVTTENVPCDKEGYVGVRTTVEDNGIGMSEDFIPHIFEAFERENNTTVSKVVGTGLGMPIVKKLVELMGGTIDVESELGKGSKFTVTIMHKEADPKLFEENETVSDEDIMHVFSGKKVLLVEDNELNAEIAQTILEGMGFVVDRAEDGVICVNKMEQSEADTYDVILMDIQMPNMDGYKATRIIRRLSDNRKANIPIVAMTANAFEEDKKKAFEMGMNGHIAKPISIEIIQKTLAPLLKE